MKKKRKKRSVNIGVGVTVIEGRKEGKVAGEGKEEE